MAGKGRGRRRIQVIHLCDGWMGVNWGGNWVNWGGNCGNKNRNRNGSRGSRPEQKVGRGVGVRPTLRGIPLRLLSGNVEVVVGLVVSVVQLFPQHELP